MVTQRFFRGQTSARQKHRNLFAALFENSFNVESKLIQLTAASLESSLGTLHATNYVSVQYHSH